MKYLYLRKYALRIYREIIIKCSLEYPTINVLYLHLSGHYLTSELMTGFSIVNYGIS